MILIRKDRYNVISFELKGVPRLEALRNQPRKHRVSDASAPADANIF